MEIEQELERIDELGFETTVSWNGYIQFSKKDNGEEDSFVLMYTYYTNEIFTFTEAFIETINIFYSWYYNYTKSGTFVGIGNIDNMVDRHFKIERVLA